MFAAALLHGTCAVIGLTGGYMGVMIVQDWVSGL